MKTVAHAYKSVMTWPVMAGYAAAVVVGSIVARFFSVDFLASLAPNAKDALSLMWQVHAAVISIGFTGLAITFHLVADPQLSPGPARRAIVEEIRFGQLLVLGVASDLAIGISAVWFYSHANVFLMFVFGFFPSILAIAITYGYSAHLFARPHKIEDLTVSDLVRLVRASAENIAENRENNRLLDKSMKDVSNVSMSTWTSSVNADYVVKYSGKSGVVSSFDVARIRQLSNLLASAEPMANIQPNGDRPVALVRVRAGERIYAGITVFELFGIKKMTGRLLDQLGSLANKIVLVSGNIESPGEIIERDLEDLQEVLVGAIINKRYPSVRRGFEHYDTVIAAIRNVVDARSEDSEKVYFDSEWKWLNRHFWEINEVAGSSGPRMAVEATDAIFGRCSEAFNSNDIGFFSASVYAYSQIWSELLKDPSGNEDALEYLLISLQNLAEWKIPYGAVEEGQADIYVKLSLDVWASILRSSFDSKNERWAIRALGYEAGLYQFSSKKKSYRGQVQQSLVVVLAWLLYRRDLHSENHVHGVLQIIEALRSNASDGGHDMLIDIAAAHASGIDSPLRRWEMEGSLPLQGRVLRASEFIAKAGLLAFSSYPTVSTAGVTRQVYEFAHIALQYIDSLKSDLDPAWSIKPEYLTVAAQQLQFVIGRWRTEVRENLRRAALDEGRVTKFMQALTVELQERNPLIESVSLDVRDKSPSAPLKVFGRRFTAPKWYFVESDVFANPEELGQRIGRTIKREEEVAVLRRFLEIGRSSSLSLSKVLRRISSWASGAQSPIVLIFNSFDAASFLNFDEDEMIVKVEGRAIKAFHLFVNDIDEHIALVDISVSPRVGRWPESKDGLESIGETSVAVGVADEGSLATDEDETPLVTVEFGTYVEWLDSKSGYIEFLRVSDLVED